MADTTAALKVLVTQALKALAEERGSDPSELPQVRFERPKQESHGDWATNVAMQSCRLLKANPRELAQEIAGRIGSSPYIDAVEVAGPGFINFYLSNRWMEDLVGEIFAAGADYGRCDLGKGRRALLEFVSANPTGPLHVGHGRGAAVGDITGNVLAFAGWEVVREYYVNDAGLQMSLLGRSTQARYFELLGQPEKAPFPDDGYKGDYIYDLAREIIAAQGQEFLNQPPQESLAFFQKYAADAILQGIKDDLDRFGVHFDNFYSEKSLYDRGLVPQATEALKQRGHLYQQDQALWFRSTDYGDDKDRVMFRSNGVPTYFASDVAYHKDKFDRGFDLVLDIVGSDHHGYIPRVRAAIEALGFDPQAFGALLIQFVNLLRDGVPVAMSTRSGQFVTLRDVIDEVGVDATRYYFVMRRSDSHLDFDLALAKRESTDNPVFYVQYAYARISSILRKTAEKGLSLPTPGDFRSALLTAPEEKRLMTRLSQFPDEVVRAASDLEPHRVVAYLHELAGDFHSFYNAGRILEEQGELQKTHLILVEAVRIVLTNALKLLGVSMPERM